MKLKNLTILLILLSLAMLLVSGCDDRDVPTSSKTGYRITRLESSVDKIYADNNVTFSYISAYVKDGNNFGASEIPVKFQADRGSIVSIVNTNTSGIAKTPFYDAGEVGLATISAHVYTYSEYVETEVTGENSMQIQVLIEPKPPIGDLNIEITSSEFFVNQSVMVRARVYDTAQNPVADSTMIRFETDRGYFIDSDGETNLGSIAIVPTQNGNAPLTLNVGQQAGVGQVTVKIDTLVSSSLFSVKPGNPFNLQIKSYLGDDDLNIVEETNETTIDNEYNIVIQADLKDAYNNSNSNKVIRFETSLGSFYNTSATFNQSTNADGICKVIFTPGLSSGPATIKAFANSDTLSSELLFTIKSDELHSIRFNTTDQINLNVANTGGVDSKILYVNLFDINGNSVDNATDIYFKIINGTIPGTNEGLPATLSGQDSDGVVHTTSSGGQAAVSVVAGAGSGVLQLRVSNDIDALTDTTIPGTISATKTNILIHAGPPDHITWGDISFDQGASVGAGMWELLVGVSVKDTHDNPVEFGTSVFFEIDDSSSGLPVTIQANSWTGNGPYLTEIDAGDVQIDSTSSIGIAYTLLTYSGSLTYSDVKINAICIGSNGVEILKDHVIELPWNEPDSDIQVTPGHADFFDLEPGATLNDHLWATITVRSRDGQGYPTPNVPWTFTSDRGTFFAYDPLPDLGNPAETNAASSDLLGYAKILLKVRRGDGLPSADGVSPGQQQVAIEAMVLGTGITERGDFMILRFPSEAPDK